jgi:hypothetical protein
MKKPEFPKPRLIREDFLPEPMNKYRIKKLTTYGFYGEVTYYYPQEKRLFWWFNIFSCEPYFEGGFLSLEKAQEKLCDYCKKDVVEYIDFDPNEDCK